MTVNEKLIQFVDYLGTSQRKFTKACGLSEGALRGKNSIGADKLGRIKRIHPELNLEWVTSEKEDSGEMLLPEKPSHLLNEEGGEYQIQQTVDKIIDRKIDIKFKELQKQIAVIIDTQDLVIDKVFEEGWKEVQKSRNGPSKNKKAN